MIAGTYLVAVVLDQLFHPINHKEESIFSNHTDIPGSQPSFRIQNLGGGLLVTKVTCTMFRNKLSASEIFFISTTG
jgi:hypothetical protein